MSKQLYLNLKMKTLFKVTSLRMPPKIIELETTGTDIDRKELAYRAVRAMGLYEPCTIFDVESGQCIGERTMATNAGPYTWEWWDLEQNNDED